MESLCEVTGCGIKKSTSKYCIKHFKNFLEYGTPTYVLPDISIKEKSKCSIDSCTRPMFSSNFCGKHYYRFKKYGDPNITRRKLNKSGKCEVVNCYKLSVSKNMCDTHYRRFRKHGDCNKTLHNFEHMGTCKILGCGKKWVAKDLCGSHYRKLSLFGDPMYTRPKLEKKEMRERQKIKVREYRKQLMSFLGNKCAICGFDKLGALELDHINNDGKADRIRFNKNRASFYKWYLENKEETIKSIQLLCANCHRVKTSGFKIY